AARVRDKRRRYVAGNAEGCLRALSLHTSQAAQCLEFSSHSVSTNVQFTDNSKRYTEMPKPGMAALEWKQKTSLLGRATSSVPSTETGVMSRLILWRWSVFF